MSNTSLPRDLQAGTVSEIIHAVSDWAAACASMSSAPAPAGRGALDWDLLDRILRGTLEIDEIHRHMDEAKSTVGLPSDFIVREANWLPEQFAEPVIAAVREYIDILETSDRPLPPNPTDVRQSALLLRLLGGKHALSEAPPISFGHPWYDVVERIGPHRCQVGGEIRQGGKIRLLIDQSPWDIVEKTSPNSYLVRWPGRVALYRVSKNAQLSDKAFSWLIQPI